MKVILLSIFLLILGCTNTLEKEEEVDTVRTIEEIVVRETEYIKKSPGESIGLAMSGGGVRSASFNIGVMGGLADSGLLDEVDYISSVSGGSYAAYWYYTKLKWNGDERENLFKMKYSWEEETEDDREYRFQQYLENNMKLGRYSENNPDRSFDRLKTTGAVTWRVVYAIPFAVMDSLQLSRLLETNYSPVPDYFRNSIERVYGFSPEKSSEDFSVKNGEYVNRGKLPWRLEKFGFEELTELYREEDVPIWIINTTADVNSSWPRWKNSWKESPGLNKAVFEFTPFTYGNEWYGHYESDSLEENLSHFVQTSGAALDSANHYNLKAGGIILSTLSMGNYVDIGEDSVYLTDGGHSENLGAYSLIKRGVGKIIISDAEYGIEGKLTGLIRLLNKLGDEYTFEFEHDEFNEYLNRWKMLSKDEKKQAEKRIEDGRESLPDMLPLILKGSITKKSSLERMEIYYIKLRAAKKILKDSSEEDHYYSEEVKKILSSSGEENEKFPQNRTTNMWYTKSQYQSYFTLGEHLGRVTAEILEGTGEQGDDLRLAKK